MNLSSNEHVLALIADQGKAGGQKTDSGQVKAFPGKRLVDILAASLALLAIFPLLVVIAVSIKLADKGPIFYVHRRIGQNGRAFGCLKFRTMHLNGDCILKEYLRRDAGLRHEWQTTRKLRNDPRVTRIGWLLRRTSFDELPQIWNILVGDMSVVGPRPVILEELREYYVGDAVTKYCSVRPGLTGLWQVSGRSDLNYQERVFLDCAYVDSLSLATDLRLIMRTLGVLLRARGAY